jgi:NADPH2:quinone reductase
MADMGVVVYAAGGPEAMQWTELDTAAPGPREARIVQHAVGVNFIDTYFRSGLYPWPSTPLIPGAEASGVVEDVGPGVTGLAPGDRVAYTMPLGAYRTRRAVPADRLVKLPASISFETAASVMLKGLTAQFLLTSCFAVQEGHAVLVHAAAGGVGLLLGQWLRLLGATAIGTVGSADKVEIAKANGYAHVIDNKSEDFAARVLEITGGGRCDVVYDSVGNDTWRGSLKCLKLRGTFVCFGQCCSTTSRRRANCRRVRMISSAGLPPAISRPTWARKWRCATPPMRTVRSPAAAPSARRSCCPDDL